MGLKTQIQSDIEYSNMDGTEIWSIERELVTSPVRSKKKSVDSKTRPRKRKEHLPKNFTSSLMKTDYKLAPEPNCMFFIDYCLFMFKLTVR